MPAAYHSAPEPWFQAFQAGTATTMSAAVISAALNSWLHMRTA